MTSHSIQLVACCFRSEQPGKTCCESTSLFAQSSASISTLYWVSILQNLHTGAACIGLLQCRCLSQLTSAHQVFTVTNVRVPLHSPKIVLLLPWRWKAALFCTCRAQPDRGVSHLQCSSCSMMPGAEGQHAPAASHAGESCGLTVFVSTWDPPRGMHEQPKPGSAANAFQACQCQASWLAAAGPLQVLATHCAAGHDQAERQVGSDCC